MKKRFFLKALKRILLAMLSLSLLLTGVACNDDPNTPEETTESATIGQIIETDPPKTENKEPEDDGRLRILVTADVHYTYQEIWYGVHQDVRMQHWVDSIKEEHEKNPFDLIVVAGDTSLDHWAAKGSWTKDKVSCTKQFIDKYVSQLPKDVPVFVLPGNHEQYTNAEWKAITGNERQGSVVIGNNLFIMLDNFRETLGDKYGTHPDYGMYSAPDSPVDVDFVKEQMALYPEHDVWLIAHWFQMSIQPAEFGTILRDTRVKGLFQGHSHVTTVTKLDGQYGSKSVATCGNFSYSGTQSTKEELYNSFWGFRELIIDPGKFAISNYIIVKTDIEIGNASIHVPYKKTASVRFY